MTGRQPRSGSPSTEPGRPAIPPGLAKFMRPVLPELTAAISGAIQERIADYGPHGGASYLTTAQWTITQAIGYFVDHIRDPSTPRDELDETLRRLGRGEAYEGRSLQSLQDAFHLGSDLAWQRIAAAAEDPGLPAEVLAALRAEVEAFVQTLSTQSAIGFHEAQAQLSNAAHQWRSRILDLILAGPAAPHGELTALAAAGDWPLPTTVALLAVQHTVDTPLPGSRVLRPGCLAKLLVDEPVVLIPAPVSPALRAELEIIFAGHRIALGCEVPLAEAATSLRWARLALQLAETGVIADQRLIDCREHIGTLWLHSEPLLADIVNRTLLAPLYAEPPNSRHILGQTLLALIQTSQAGAPAIAAQLGKHPQTIRYRLKRLRELFGDVLDNPEAVMQMHYALRASVHRWNPEPAHRPRRPSGAPGTATARTDD